MFKQRQHRPVVIAERVRDAEDGWNIEPCEFAAGMVTQMCKAPLDHIPNFVALNRDGFIF